MKDENEKLESDLRSMAAQLEKHQVDKNMSHEEITALRASYQV